MEFSQHQQDCVIKLMIEDIQTLSSCRRYVEPELFNGEILQRLVRKLYNYFDEFKRAPANHFEDYILDTFSEKESDLELLAEYMDKNIEVLQKGEINKQYILQNLTRVAKYQKYRKVFLKSAQILGKNNLDTIDKMFSDILVMRLDSEIVGQDFTEFTEFGYIDNDENLISPTGVEALDKRIRGYYRKELFVWLGATNVGKSWTLVDGAAKCLMKGKKVVYFTLEMSKKAINNRVGMNLTGLRSRESRETEYMETLDGEEIPITDEILKSTSPKLLKIMEDITEVKGVLITIELIEGKTSILDLENALNMLEIQKNFIPDVVFVDYADEMISTRRFNNDTDAIDNVYRELRGMAKERNLGVVTASQANREGFDKKKVGLKHTAGSIGKVRIADTVISLNRTDEEEENNEMRLFAAKVREGSSKGFSIKIKQCFATGQFCLESEDYVEDTSTAPTI